MDQVDVVVIGAGVVGLAIAAELSKQFDDVLVVDQHGQVGEETSSRNSEVIHAGIYYPQGSLKAKLCVKGKERLYDYCKNKNIPHSAIGKLIVATETDELDGLASTLEKANANGVNDLEYVTDSQLNKITPELKAIEALHSPSTGIIDSHAYMQSLLADLERNNGMFIGRTRCEKIQKKPFGFEVTFNSQGEEITIRSKFVINSAGLGAQQIATSVEGMPESHIPKLHLCRGHYFSYAGKSPFSQLIYPLPEKNGAGLGIHATLDMGGQLRFGPDTEYLNEGINYQFELSSLAELKAKFVGAIRRYWPDINPDKLQPAYTGIRPKLQGPNDSVKDFVIQNGADFDLDGLINLYGIESPGLTSSLAIADLVEKILNGK